ncbi:hypothetical protein WJX72_009361 [[Myrmecia] bisecta]|uniref:Formate/nitrite transporter n=1 Tax=[Myrmecia] bisecta TaxID=41462 RepID=A0AAW1PZ34_9CHLO
MVLTMGSAKAQMPWWKTLWLAVLAGFYLSFGGCLSFAVGGQMPAVMQDNPGLQKLVFGAFGLPFGLALIVICGAELLTSNFAFLPVAMFEGKCNLWQVLKNWFIVFWGNLAGSLFLVWLVDEAYLFQQPAYKAGYLTSQTVAFAKTHSEWGDTVARGILCNWLVCLAVWQATAAQDIIGKIFGIFFPIMAFVAIGFDHVVANMFVIPFGMKMGSNVSVGDFVWHSTIPVFIGNMIPAVFFVAMSYSFCYGTLMTTCRMRLGRFLPHKDPVVVDPPAAPRQMGQNDSAFNHTVHAAEDKA